MGTSTPRMAYGLHAAETVLCFVVSLFSVKSVRKSNPREMTNPMSVGQIEMVPWRPIPEADPPRPERSPVPSGALQETWKVKVIGNRA